MSDPINPFHYKRGNLECIDAIKAALTEENFHGYLRGNVIKYLWRCHQKGALIDLKKAQWYLNRLVAESEQPVQPQPPKNGLKIV